MKNLLNRLTRFMIIMLLLVDRTPFFNVYASSTFKLEIDYTDSLVNAGVGQGQYDIHLDPADSDWALYCSTITTLSTSAEIVACLAHFGVTPATVTAAAQVTYPNYTFGGFSIIKIEYENDGDMKFVGIAALLIAPNLPAVANNDTATTDEDTALDIAVLANDSDPEGDAFTVTSVSDPANGTATINLDGTVHYVPDLNYFGPDSFTYTITGGDTATVNVTVNSVDDLPVANDDTATTNEDTAVDINVLANDTDLEGNAFTVISVSDPANGTATINLDGTVHYVPDLNYFGSDSFTYTITGGDTANVSITVVSVNDPGTAVDDETTTPEDTPINIDVLSNDIDVEDNHTVASVGTTINGVVSINLDGTVRFVPNLDFVGEVNFTYTLDSGSSANVKVIVTPVDDLPTAVNDTDTTDEDTAVDIDVLTNDLNSDGGPLTVESVTQGTNGSVEINLDGTVKYTPDADFNGSDSFTYTLNGGSTATVTVTITAVDDLPTAVNDTDSTDEDTAVDIDVLANDLNTDGGPLTVESVTQGTDGSVSINIDGTVKYTPDADFNGSDSFTYTLNGGSTATVTVTINAVDDLPTAVNDTDTSDEDTAVDIDVLANDLNLDGGPLTVESVTQGTDGSVSINIDGTVKYTPDADFNGSDSFTYTLNGGSTATVTVTITAINDAPIANDDTYSTNEDVTLTVTAPGVLGNDSDVDNTLTVSVVLGSEPAEGTLTLNSNGSFTYVPAPNKFGTYTFSYRATDGSLSDTAVVTINVISDEDDPTATPSSFTVNEGQQYSGSVTGVDGDGDVLTYFVDTIPAHGTLNLLTTGSFTYTHDGTETPNVDKFTFKVSDDGGLTFSAPADVDITILDVNDAPVAVNDSYTTAEDTQLVVPVITGVLANDTDAEGNTLSASVVANPANGSVILAADGSFTYTPDANFNGSDSFTYQVNDGLANSNIATVTITISAANDTPTADSQTLSTNEDTPLDITLTGDDEETDSDDLIFTVTSGPSHGSITGTGASITYTPALNYNGPDSFTFTVSDGSLTSAAATVSITVNPINNAPVAVADSYSTNEDTLLTVPTPGILGNDDDVDEDPLTIEVVDDVVDGVLVVNANGSFTYTPDANFNGIDSFTYKINDGTVDSNTVTVTITVNAINDRPVADDQSLTTPEDTPLNITLTGTDTEGSSLLFGVSVAPSHGTLSGTAPSLVYTPDENYFGSDSFIFGISDGFYRDYATITINVTPVNDRPIAEDDEVTTPEDTAILINFDASDVETASLLYGIVSQPTNGTLSGTGDSRTYTPNANFVGTDTFVFGVSDGYYRDYATITVNVTPVNDAPVAVSNLYATDEDTALIIPAPGVLGNDTDAEDDSLTSVLVSGVSFGTLTLNADGSFTYTPTDNFSGLDSFTYKANDGALDSEDATVMINVNSVEDAPVAVDDPEDEEIDVIETPEDTPLVLDFEDLLANDYDVDDLTFGQMTLMLTPLRSFDFNTAFSPSVGSLTLDMIGRTVTFNPPLNYVGPASFEYTIIDEDENVSEPATVSIEVTPVNDAPVASPLAFTIANAGSSTGQLVASDVDDTELVFSLLAAPTNGTATVSPTGAYTYTHNGTATLSDSFTFSVTDGELSATAVVTVTITAAPTPPPVNLPPVANALAFTIANGAVSTGTLTGSDPEGAPISFAIATLPANGSLTISPAGIYVYDHNGTATTADSFTFTVSDGSLTSTATVSITILPIPAPGNTPPEVIDGVESTPFGEGFDSSVAILGSDADGDDLTFALVDDVTNGTLVFNPDGTYTYTPNEGFEGSDSFTFIANDGTDDSNTGTLTINVLEEEVIVEEPETPLAAPDNNWLWWLLALLAGLLLWLLAFLRPNMKYTLSDKANNQKIVRRRLSKPDDKTMIVELNDKDMVGLVTIEVEFFKRLAKHCGDVTVKFMLKGTQVHSVTIPAGIDDAYTTIIHL